MRLVCFLTVVLLLGGCTQPEKSKPIPFKTTGDVKHTMQWVLDPAADHIWDSAGSVITAEGVEELAPTTDEGWLAVQHSAVVVAETGNLLLMPSRARDDQDWQEIALGLIDVGMRAAKAAEAKDADALFEVGGQLYRVCVSCHTQYMQGDEKRDPLTE
jgi:hypothetical protein|tara:strand:+ start:1054 stop:1527 length:474 start_codon:yes stop_codon:yes gene_type:complete